MHICSFSMNCDEFVSHKETETREDFSPTASRWWYNNRYAVPFFAVLEISGSLIWSVIGLEREGKPCKSLSKGNKWMCHLVYASISNARCNDLPAWQERMPASR